MKLKCYRINEENQLAETPFETLLESWSRGEGCYWIDVEDYQTEELSTWLSSFNLSSMAMQVCTQCKSALSKVKQHGLCLFVRKYSSSSPFMPVGPCRIASSYHFYV